MVATRTAATGVSTRTVRTPAREPVYTSKYAAEAWVRARGIRGQVSPYVRERMKKCHGRYLSGFGSVIEEGDTLATPNMPSIAELERTDDTYGSGVFDPVGRGATSNADTGVFSSHYSLPGYVGRERPFHVSPEVRDLTDNADVVVVPSGGLSYVEHNRKLMGPIRRVQEGPPPPPSKAVQALTTLTTGPTPRDHVYVHMAHGYQVPIRGGAPEVVQVPAPPMPNATRYIPPGIIPPGIMVATVSPVRQSPIALTVRSEPEERRVPTTPTFEPRDASIAIRAAAAPPLSPSARRWNGVSTQHGGGVAGLGLFEGMSNLQLGVAGVLIGAAGYVGWKYLFKRSA